MNETTHKPKIIRITAPHMGEKLQPQAKNLEEVVLGALMLDKKAAGKIIDILKPEAFYVQAHEIIYRAILRLSTQSNPIDILTVTQELKRTGELDVVGGPYYITQLTSRIASSENIEYHTHIILQKYIQRELIRVSTDTIRDAYEDTSDVFDLLDKSYSNLNEISSEVIKTPAAGTSKLFGDFVERLELLSKSESNMTGVPSTLRGLNKITRGFQKGNLIIIAGRTGMGKSAAVKSVLNGAITEMQEPILLFSLEMSASEQIARLVSEDVGISSRQFNSKEFTNNTTWGDINSAIRKYSDKDGKDLLIIDDTGSLSINEIRARAKKIHSEKKVCCIVVDYLQKLTGDSTNRTQEIEQITWGLKTLAKELDIPVVALSQLNRQVETRAGDKRPQLSDLRDSGAIEQDADLVIFLFRPEYYGIDTLEDGSSSYRYAEWIIAKNRNGELATVKAKFTDYLTKFEDWDTPDNNPVNTYNPSAGLTPVDFTIPKKDDFDDTPF